jgi:type IV pilus assembly protein PilQ
MKIFTATNRQSNMECHPREGGDPVQHNGIFKHKWYTLRILVFRVVGFVARNPRVCKYTVRLLAPRCLAETPNCSGLFVPTLKSCLCLVYDKSKIFTILLSIMLLLCLPNDCFGEVPSYISLGRAPTHVSQINQVSQSNQARFRSYENRQKLISLDFQNINIRDLIRLIAEFSHKNIIIGDHVTGRVSIKLRNVSWRQALDTVLNIQNLYQREENGVIFVLPGQQQSVRGTGLSLGDAANYSSAISLKYTTATNITDMLGKRSGAIPQNASIIANQNNNSLLISATKDQMSNIRNLVTAFDAPAQEISIEGYIVTIDDSASRELGLNFNTTSSSNANNNNGTGDMNMNLSSSVNSPNHLAFALSKIGNGSILNMELAALESEGHAKIISNPKLLTNNSQSAYIESGQEIPYQEKTSEGATSIAFKKAVLSLRVTPEIISPGRLILRLHLNQDKVSDLAVNGVPAVQTQQIETQVTVNNGETLVLGGIYEQSKIEHIVRVPILGAIPIIKYLFSKKQTDTARKELLIFVTAKIKE